MSSRAVAAATVVSALLAVSAGAVDEALFVDGFEAGDYCGWSQNPPPPTVAEGEGAGQGLNDELLTATAISRCATVEGTTGAPVAGQADFDFYRLDVAAPALLRITLEARDGTSDFEPYADVDDDDTYPPLAISPLTATASTTRQLWLPTAGTWYLFVSHAANWDRVGYLPVDPGGAGGVDSTYRLTVDVEPLGGSPAIQGLTEGLQIPTDGSLTVVRLAAGLTAMLDLAEVTAERLAPASPLDAKLYLVADPVAAPATIASCDDQYDPSGCVGALDDFTTFDPRLESVELAALPHALIVDFFDVYDGVTGDPEMLPAEFDLALQYLAFAP